MVAQVESVNFDRAAEYYDATRALPADSMAALTGLLAAELRERQPCLEIGVGTGRIALPLHGSGITLAGMDIAQAMLRRLVTNAGGRPPFPLLLADATRLPVAAASFGSVLAVHVLHLIPDWRVAVDEALRVLRPGGALLASFPGPGGPRRAPRDATGGPPWAQALREALTRHGIVRADRGARDPGQVAGYMDGRATARALEPVTVTEARTLSQALHSMERQLFSWTWPYTPQQLRTVGSDVRAWAARENVPLDAEFEVRSQIRWWAFELPRLPEQEFNAVQRVPQVVGADQVACLVHGEPAQRRLRVLRPHRVRVPGGHEVPQVGMLVRGLALARRHLAHHGVPDRRVRPRLEVGQARLLPRLAQRDPQRVALPRVGVPAHLQPHLLPLVPAQQHPAAAGMHDQRRGGEMQRQGPQPRVGLGGGQPSHRLDIGGLGLPLRLVTGQPSARHATMVPRPPDAMVHSAVTAGGVRGDRSPASFGIIVF
jgi:SAM-dependent methyltransferase